MITEPATYFAKGCGRCERFATADCATRLWHDGLARLREICLSTGMSETVRWGHPCYVHAGRNIAIIGAFRDDFRLTFFRAALMTDPEGILTRAGPNTQAAGVLRFCSTDEPDRRADVLAAYLREAMAHAEEGRAPPRVTQDIVLPTELVDALDADAELSDAFAALTPGRQRSYVINLSNAKKTETRIARIAKFRQRILAGKGATER